MQSDGPATYTEPPAGPVDTPEGAGETCVLFLVDQQKYALRLSEVERIVRSVEVKPLPQSPPHVMGIINMQGRVLPVIDLRRVLNRPPRELRLEDHFIVAQAPSVTAILPVDAALGSLEAVDAGELPDEKARDRYLRKIVPLRDEVVYVLDLERVVFGDEAPSTGGTTSLLAGVEAE